MLGGFEAVAAVLDPATVCNRVPIVEVVVLWRNQALLTAPMRAEPMATW